jgi:ATP-dependent RNA helicase DeaD
VYVHRIGRTGRVGRSGRAITLVTPKQRKEIEVIERHAKTEMREWGKAEATTSADARAEAAVATAAVATADATTTAAATDAAPKREPREPRQARRPRHTKPRNGTGPRVKLILRAGRADGIEPKDVVEAIVEQTHLENEDIANVRVLERFSLVEVPQARADEVAKNLKWKAEVAKR